MLTTFSIHKNKEKGYTVNVLRWIDDINTATVYISFDKIKDVIKYLKKEGLINE